METSTAQNVAHSGGSISLSDELESMVADLKTELVSIQVMAETAKLSVVAITTAQTQIATALADAQGKLAEATDAVTATLAVKTQITDEQSIIATKSGHIEDAKTHADSVRAELDRTLTAATKAVTDAEGAYTRAQGASDSVVEALALIKTHRSQAETDLEATVAARDSAKAAALVTKALADKTDSIETRVEEYENKLADFETKANAQLATITGLLPGATSAGLAHAFDQRRQSFLKPSTRWQWLFVGSVVALVFLALTGLWTVIKDGTPLGYDDLLRLWLARVPIAAALVWLALHASRESALAKRLEEDYGYKAAIAASFQGFQKQMADIGAVALANSPLGKLCDDTLATLASPPGRIYDKHKLTVSPASELASAARTVTDAVGEVANGKRGGT